MAIKPYAHQLEFVRRARENRRYGLFASPGTGKTIATLMVLAERPMPTLIIAPASIVEGAWLRDAQNFPELKIINGRANGKIARKKLIDSEYDAIVLNVESARLHVPDFAKRGIRRLIIDESSILKNSDSQQAKACAALSDFMDEVYLLTGTPFSNGEHELYGQLRCIDKAETGVNFWRWCSRWMVPIKISVRGRDHVKGWKLIESRKPAFQDMLTKRAWTLRKEDCLTLPPKTFIDRPVTLGDAERKAYDGLLTQLRAEFAGKTIDASAASRTMKLRQICGGFIYSDEQAHPIGQSKLDALLELLDEINKPTIVWAIFQNDLDRSAEALGDRARIVDGRTAINKRQPIFDGFGSEFPILLAHPQAAGHGVTLVQSSYAVYYSLGFSLEHYLQSIDRIHRPGQLMPCTYYRLLATDTIDENIAAVLDRKLTAVDALRAVLASADVMDEVGARF